MFEPIIFPSDTLDLDWTVGVYTPEGFSPHADHTNTRVLYALHGAKDGFSAYPLRSNILSTLDRLIGEGTLPETVVFFIDGLNSYYVDTTKLAVETALIHDLLPWLEKKYGLAPDRTQRALIGNSMGGYAAVRFLLRYPALFSYAMPLSPAVWLDPASMNLPWRAFRTEIDPTGKWDQYHPLHEIETFKSADLSSTMDIYLGADDPVIPKEDVDTLVDALRGVMDVSLTVTPGAKHDWPFWSKAADEALACWAKN